MNKTIASSLLFIALVAGFMGGFALTPTYQGMRTEAASMELGRADRWTDLRYVNGMIAHHLTAIDLAQQALEQSHREEVRTLARTIIAADTKGIETLMQWKKDWYGDEKPVTRYSKINLGSEDENFDLRFLNALTMHHEEAIDVNQDIQSKSIRNEVLTLSGEVVRALMADLETFEQWRKEWYGNN